MTPQLKAINTAIALGDWAIPPVGAFLNVQSGSVFGPRWYRVQVIERPADPGGMNVGVWAWDPRMDVPLYLAPGDPSFEVVELPEDAPPFEEWERPS